MRYSGFKTVSNTKDGCKYYRYYRCNSKTYRNKHKTKNQTGVNCTNRILLAKELDEQVIQQVKQYTFEYFTTSTPKNKQPKPLKPVEQKIKKIDEQLEKLSDLYTLGNIPMSIINKISEDLKNEKSS